MTAFQLLRGAPIAAKLREDVSAAASIFVERVGLAPVVATVLTEQNPSALAYRDAIARGMGRVGISHRPIELSPRLAPERFVEALLQLNDDQTVHGVLVLMPLAPQLSADLVFEHLSPLKDVDGITPTNAGRLHLGLPSLRPSTPQGGIELLDHYDIPLAGRDVVVIGRSNVVGRPFATLASHRDATITLCHRQTRDLAAKTRHADIVAVAAGHPHLVTLDMVRPGAVVVDFGVNVVGDQILGDVDPTGFDAAGISYTPVPGGTGPVTTMVLAHNVIAAAFVSLGGTLDVLESPVAANESR